MSGKYNKEKVAQHHHPIGATRMIPLAPPAEDKSKLKANLQNLASWLSPRVARPSSHSRRLRNESDDDDDDDENRSKKRGHQQLLIRPRGSSFDGRGSRTATTTSAGDLYRRWQTNNEHKDDRDLLSQSRSTNDSSSLDESKSYRHHYQRQHQQHQRKSGSGSLLTTFLLYFDALLPEYFSYFATAADIENNGASQAVGVLERGARTVQRHAMSPIYKRHNTISHGGDRHNFALSHDTFSAPSSPSYFLPETSLLSSKSDGEKIDNDTNTNIKQQQHHQHHHQWLTREKIQRIAGQVSPRHMKSMQLNSTLQAEWERFTSPFLMLAGAEVLYGEMEHVLDPETERRVANGESLLVSDEDGKENSSSVQFDNPKEQNDSRIHSPITSPSDSSNKLGSRRLIAMYRQVREDFIIVGEYLCDPVLGSHASIGGGGGGGASISNNSTMKSTLELTPQSSPQKIYGRSQSQPSTPEKNSTVQFSPSKNMDQEEPSCQQSQRQIAARSLRNTLDSLTAFIDARCVLVKIHADLCCLSNKAQLSTSEGSRSGNKWALLAEQCRSTMAKMSLLSANQDSMMQIALSKLETETKALELALLSVYHLMECE